MPSGLFVHSTVSDSGIVLYRETITVVSLQVLSLILRVMMFVGDAAKLTIVYEK